MTLPYCRLAEHLQHEHYSTLAERDTQAAKKLQGRIISNFSAPTVLESCETDELAGLSKN